MARITRLRAMCIDISELGIAGTAAVSTEALNAMTPTMGMDVGQCNVELAVRSQIAKTAL